MGKLYLCAKRRQKEVWLSSLCKFQGNTRTKLRKGLRHLADADTSQILNPDGLLPFWIDWTRKIIN